MRITANLICLLVTCSVALVAVAPWSTDSEHRAKQNPLFSDAASTRDKSLLDEFIATLDPDIIKECVAKHETSHDVDLDYLSTCGDFDIYARYMRISKFEAVKKFKYVVLHSSSKLEFDDWLAR
ncbi:MAG: hypothetical protein P8L85_20360 [Rubripirellula sp.]|nr:hypothetical protein [Rubripirellula sp.]